VQLLFNNLGAVFIQKKSLLLVVVMSAFCQVSLAQTPPTSIEVSKYEGLFKAAHQGDIAAASKLIDEKADLEARDSAGRTPLIVAAFASHEDMVRVLKEGGADIDALENRAYDAVTIAAVANDLQMLDLVLDLGANSGTVTSPYEGTALIAAAHLGHHQIVARLIEANAPLDHINNLQWTALMEAVVLGDGGPDHTKTVSLLLKAGADRTIADSRGITPLQHARSRGYGEIINLFELVD